MFDVIKRTAVVDAVAEEFSGKPFDLGSTDCIHMIDFALKQYGIPSELNKVGTYSTATQARRALKRLGYDSIRDAVSGNKRLVEIPAASAWVGDIIALPPEDDSGEVALALVGSNGRAFGFTANRVAEYCQPHEYVTAWRVG